MAILSLKKVIILTGMAGLVSGCTPTQFNSLPPPEESSSSPTQPGSATPTPALTPPLKTVDAFTQSSAGNQIDILIVNDNSVSMAIEQAKLGERFSSFISGIADIDYHIGMTTTDLDSPLFNQGGRLVTWTGTSSQVLTPSTPNAEKVFGDTIRRQETLDCDGTVEGCPSGNEQPLLATIRAVEQRETANFGFFREKAPLIVIILSDEDEKSNSSSGATEPKAVLEAVYGAFGFRKTLVVSGIIVKPGDTACLAEQKGPASTGTAYFGQSISDLIHATGGKDISICEADFATPLAELSRAMRKLVTSYWLSDLPEGDVEVIFTPHVDIGYRIDGRTLILDAPPPAGTKIEVIYPSQ